MMMLFALPMAALLALPPAAAAPPSISLTLNTSASANGPQAPGQTFSMTMMYQWSNASNGMHNLTVSFALPPVLEIVNSSSPLGGNPNGIRTVGRSFKTLTGGPFNQSSNTSGNGSFTLALRFRPGVTAGTQVCVKPSITDAGSPGPSSQQCFTAGGNGGPSGPGGPGGGMGGGPGGGSNMPVISHWAIAHELVDGTGISAPTAIFRVRIVNSSAMAQGEPGLVSPSVNYSVINPAKIVAVSQGPSASSGLPVGWAISGALPSASITVTGPATLAPTATLPVLYLHVSLTGVALGGTNQAMASLIYKLSSNPQSAPLVIGNTKEIRVVTVLK
ncbi:MAG: hypothetical protein ACYC3F_07155 [Gemmatimonadaceae bacterium]